ncbi:MAG: Asp-tRNA(Asn)/Glu-tRNA(Gln) amidotransferase subunit GatC [Deltaproteobacteria bacterium]|nr:Asp-tRNA(Asn)/Glu-tRNA(Gln) amidotransferase subunit GatC [Deltaproteobacteria bacterium]
MDEAQIRKIAKLARLEVAEEDLPRLAGDLRRILGYVERLQQADLSELPSPGAPPETGAKREDEVRPSFTPEEATANAPAAEDGAFLVPRVIG